MFTVVKRKLLEDALPPAKLLYLSDAAVQENTAADMANCIGTLLATFPSALPNYMREVGMVWGRYRTAAVSAGASVTAADALAEDYGSIRMAYVRQLYQALPSVVCPPPPVSHCRGLVSLLQRVAATTSFGRTGDAMVHKTILTQVPPEKAARLSTMEMPFGLAGETFGEGANKRVRGYFERNVETDFTTTAWETTGTPEDFIFAATILFETGGDLYSAISTAAELGFQVDNPAPTLFVWEAGQFGVMHRGALLFPQREFHFPVISALLHFLELVAYAGTDGAAAARSILCAVKTPKEVRRRRPRPRAACALRLTSPPPRPGPRS